MREVDAPQQSARCFGLQPYSGKDRRGGQSMATIRHSSNRGCGGYPGDHFYRGRGAAGTGRRFFTMDHRADLTVQSVPNPEHDSPATFLAKRQPPAGIQYKRVTPRFFAVSSIRNGRTWYNRCNRADEYMHCVLINYPAAEDRQWDAVVTRISLSLTR
jgi:hypothetical protein